MTDEEPTRKSGPATVDHSVSKAVAGITRCRVIVIDGIGMPPCGQATGGRGVVPLNQSG
ncbi:hypothetical protein ABZT08_23395 [Streptomyces sp. NPDC005526]|uniref:hypothetical protein n=1 Tax=Streptomyces sp. NPDC005526 TaxID=3156885 RepID=UPI0033BB5DC3